MAIQQLSVFVENQPGKLLAKVKALAEAGINLRAMSIADTKDFGILRVIASDTEKAREVLAADSIVVVTDVVAVQMNDETGALYDILKVLGDAGINVEYLYAFTASGDHGAYVALRVDDNENAEKALAASGIDTLKNDDALTM